MANANAPTTALETEPAEGGISATKAEEHSHAFDTNTPRANDTGWQGAGNSNSPARGEHGRREKKPENDYGEHEVQEARGSHSGGIFVGLDCRCIDASRKVGCMDRLP